MVADPVWSEFAKDPSPLFGAEGGGKGGDLVKEGVPDGEPGGRDVPSTGMAFKDKLFNKNTNAKNAVVSSVDGEIIADFILTELKMSGREIHLSFSFSDQHSTCN